MVPTVRCYYGSKFSIAILAFCAMQLTIFGQASSESRTAKLQKDYAEINKYLASNVGTEDPVINFEKLEQLLEEKSSKCTRLLTGRGFTKTLKLIHKFTTIPSEYSLCHGSDGRQLMELVDSGLTSELRSAKSNYSPGRVDRIIEHYSFEISRKCKFDGMRPMMNYGLRQNAYDMIDSMLSDTLPADADVGKNMDKAKELSQKLSPTDVALAEAFKQFLSLELTLDEKSCNEQGFEILFKNDLATRGRAYQYSTDRLRRVDKIVLHFARGHEKICSPIVRKTLGLKLKKLDRNTYLRILGLVSVYYLGQSRITDILENLNRKQVDENFVIQPMREYAKSAYSKPAPYMRLDQILSITAEELYDYIRAISDGDETTLSFNPPVDKEYNKQIVNDRQYKQLLNEYLFDPCKRYLEAVGPSVEVDKYGIHVNGRHLVSARDHFLEDLSYHTIRAGYQACTYITKAEDHIRADLRKSGKIMVVIQLADRQHY